MELCLKGKISSTFLKESSSEVKLNKKWHLNDVIAYYFNLMNTLSNGEKEKYHIAKAYIINLLKNYLTKSFA